MSAMTSAPLLDRNERRFPLAMGPTIPKIRELYLAATRNQWDPQRDIDWDALDPDDFDDEHREAARNWWSRRGWGEYGAISESPTLHGALHAGPAAGRDGAVLRPAHAGRGAPRRDLLQDGRAPGRLHPGAGARRPHQGDRQPRRAQDGARPQHQRRTDHRRAGVRPRGVRLRLVPADGRQGHPSGGEQGAAPDPARRDAALRVRLAVHRVAPAAHERGRDRAHAPGVHRHHHQRRAGRLPRAVARAGVGDDPRGERASTR